MKEQNVNTKQKRTERLDTRATKDEKDIILDHCTKNNISITNFLITSALKEIKSNSLKAGTTKQINDNAFYNYVVAYSAKSHAVKKMLKDFNQGGFNHEK